MTSGPSDNKSTVGTTHEFLKALKDKNADVDESGYVPFLEAANLAVQKRTVNGI